MRNVLIFTAALTGAGCSTVSDMIPDALDRAPLIYRPTIQQGNVVTQEQVDELKPGMTRRQVRFVLGTPMLSDVFHANRWDYTYTMGKGSRPEEIRHVTVFFEEDRLVRIAGDLRPRPPEEREETAKEVVVSVPDWEPERKSLWHRFVSMLGFGGTGN